MAANSNDTTGLEMSPESRLVAEQYGILDRAETHFWREMHTVFNAAVSDLEEAGFLTSVNVDEEHHHGMIQVSKPNWPKPFQNGIHFEIWADRGRIVRDKGLMLFLDIEEATSGKDDIIDALWRILMPYEKAGLLKRAVGCKMRPQKTWRFFEELLPLQKALSSSALSDVLRKIATISWAIDQALFVKGGKPVWRTDFLPQQERPRLRWGDGNSEGGQAFVGGEGLLGSGCVRIDASSVGSYHEWEGRPTDIMVLGKTEEIRNGDELYVSIVARTVSQSYLLFYGEGHRDQPDGEREFPPLCDWAEMCIAPSSDWQHVSCRVHTRSPADYDFSRDGASLFLRTQTDDPAFSIGAIEIGRC